MNAEMTNTGCEKISLVKDPFNTESIISIFVRSSKSFGTIKHYGIVEFKNGSTSGKQRFDADSFDSVVIQIRNFISTI